VWGGVYAFPVLDFLDLVFGARGRSGDSSSSEDGREVRLPIDWECLTLEMEGLEGDVEDEVRALVLGRYDCSCGVPEPETKRDVTSSLEPYCDGPFDVGVCEDVVESEGREGFDCEG